MKRDYKKERIGYINTAKNGLKFIVIDYNGCKDVTIKFLNDGIIKKCRWQNILEHQIVHPKFNKTRRDFAKERVGVKKTLDNGEVITVVEWNGCENIVVRWEDGTIKKTSWSEFRKRNIKKPDEFLNKRIGEKIIAHNGMEMEIIAYRGNQDLDVRFTDGTIVYHQRYDAFRERRIQNPNISNPQRVSYNELFCAYYFQQIGFKRYGQDFYNKLGLKNREFDLYNPQLRIAIEYDGNCMGHKKHVDRDIAKDNLCKELGIRLYRIRECGLIDYSSNESVKFYHLSTNKHGSDELLAVIKAICEDISDYEIEIKASDEQEIIEYFDRHYITQKHIGERNIHKRLGVGMTLVSWQSNRKVGVKFDDNEQVIYTTYENFRKGWALHP